jgi:hypothetical protein
MADNKYQRGKIYMITSPHTEEIYIGSTCEPTLARRLAKHVMSYKLYQEGKSCYYTSYKILEAGDYEISLIDGEMYCDTKQELQKWEQMYINEYPNCVNQCKAYVGLSEKEYKAKYYQDNIEKAKAQHVEYRATHQAEIKDYSKRHYTENKQHKIDYQRRYVQENRAQIAAKRAEVIQCECGSQYTRLHKNRHYQTKKHLNAITA